MKIYKSESECRVAAEKAMMNAPKGSFIDNGSYKGGLYDCIFILHPENGSTIFEGAF
jgi:hypothetical protein